MTTENSKARRRQTVLIVGALGGLGAIAVLGMFALEPSSRSRDSRSKTVSITAPGTIEDRDAWRARQAAREKANEVRIKEVQRDVNTQETETKKLMEALRLLEASAQRGAASSSLSTSALSASASASTSASTSASPLPPVPAYGSALPHPLPPELREEGAAHRLDGGLSGERALSSMPPLPGVTEDASGPAGVVPLPPRRQLEMIEFGAGSGTDDFRSSNSEVSGQMIGFSTSASKKTGDRGETGGIPSANVTGSPEPIQVLPAGSFVRVAMLNGVDAPTGGQAQSNPLPVAFHVLDLANLANRQRLDIRDCRFVAAAWGDLSSERMMGRTETLACVIEGESVEMPVKGVVIGEDGKAGVRGRLVTKQGQLLASALFAGALSGIGTAVQQSATVTSSTAMGLAQSLAPNRLGQAVVGGGVGNAGQMLAQYYLKAADKLFPVIETDGGRTVEILITKGAVYTGSANQGRQGRSYAGLLKRESTSYGRERQGELNNERDAGGGHDDD